MGPHHCRDFAPVGRRPTDLRRVAHPRGSAAAARVVQRHLRAARDRLWGGPGRASTLLWRWAGWVEWGASLRAFAHALTGGYAHLISLSHHWHSDRPAGEVISTLETFSWAFVDLLDLLRDLRRRVASVDARSSLGARPLEVTEGRITRPDVRFSHPGRAPLSDGLSLSISPGEHVGLVGSSGAGKTTLAKLVLRIRGHRRAEHGHRARSRACCAEATSALGSEYELLVQEAFVVAHGRRDGARRRRPLRTSMAPPVRGFLAA